MLFFRLTVKLIYIYTAITYAVVSTVFSVIACLIPVAVVWTFIIHAALLALFAIRFIALSAGGGNIGIAHRGCLPSAGN